jgi:hypothetical protein
MPQVFHRCPSDTDVGFIASSPAPHDLTIEILLNECARMTGYHPPFTLQINFCPFCGERMPRIGFTR